MNSVPTEPSSKHLGESRLAALASGSRAHDEEELHLTLCRRCSAAYAELVHTRGVDSSETLDVPAEILDAGHRFVDERIAKAPVANSNRFAAGRRWALVLAAAAALALMLTPLLQRDAEGLLELPPSLRAELVSDSSHGLIHPLATKAESFDTPALRGGAQLQETAALDELQRQFEADPRSLEAAITLVSAFQAVDQLRNARSYLEASLERHPSDSTLQALAIEQAYREGRSDEAESLLRTRLAANPDDDITRLNLAILLHFSSRSSDRAESARLAAEVTNNRPNGPLAARARRLVG